MIGLWGTPGTSHPDALLRAAAAAVEVRARLAGVVAGAAHLPGMGLGADAYHGVHAGLAAGHVFCGNVGTPSRCTYTVVGAHLRR